MKSKLKAPGTVRLKLKHLNCFQVLLSKSTCAATTRRRRQDTNGPQPRGARGRKQRETRPCRDRSRIRGRGLLTNIRPTLNELNLHIFLCASASAFTLNLHNFLCASASAFTQKEPVDFMLRAWIKCLFSMTLLHGAQSFGPFERAKRSQRAGPWIQILSPRRRPRQPGRQGLTQVHFSAQPEPFFTSNTP
jgi:hypothetical protein